MPQEIFALLFARNEKCAQGPIDVTKHQWGMTGWVQKDAAITEIMERRMYMYAHKQNKGIFA